MQNTAYIRNKEMQIEYVPKSYNPTMRNYMEAFEVDLFDNLFPYLLELFLLQKKYEKNFKELDVAFKRKDQEEHRRLLKIEKALLNRGDWLRDMLNGRIGKKGIILPCNECFNCRYIIYDGRKHLDRCEIHRTERLTERKNCL